MNSLPVRVDGWKAVRVSLAFTTLFVAALLVLYRVTGSPRLCGAGCRIVQDRWYSPLFLVGLTLGSSFLVASQFTWSDQIRRRIALCLGICALVALGAMSIERSFCSLCFAAQSIWLALALEATGSIGFRVVALAIAGLGLEASYEAWNLASRPVAKPISFEARSWERLSRVPPHAFVVFTDPYSQTCRQDERIGQPGKLGIPMLYRWKILPQDGARAVALAAALESAMRVDRQNGLELLHSAFSTASPPNEQEFISKGMELGFARAQLKTWIEQPEADSLNAIANDKKLADEMGISQIPTLCSVDPNGPDGGSVAIRPIRRNDIDAYAFMTHLDLGPLRAFLN